MSYRIEKFKGFSDLVIRQKAANYIVIFIYKSDILTTFFYIIFKHHAGRVEENTKFMNLVLPV